MSERTSFYYRQLARKAQGTFQGERSALGASSTLWLPLGAAGRYVKGQRLLGVSVGVVDLPKPCVQRCVQLPASDRTEGTSACLTRA
jgi:hypothetical protein